MARSPDFEGEQSKVTSILRAIGFITTSRSIATRQHRANTPRVANDLLFD